MLFRASGRPWHFGTIPRSPASHRAGSIFTLALPRLLPLEYKSLKKSSTYFLISGERIDISGARRIDRSGACSTSAFNPDSCARKSRGSSIECLNSVLSSPGRRRSYFMGLFHLTTVFPGPVLDGIHRAVASAHCLPTCAPADAAKTATAPTNSRRRLQNAKVLREICPKKKLTLTSFLSSLATLPDSSRPPLDLNRPLPPAEFNCVYARPEFWLQAPRRQPLTARPGSVSSVPNH